MSISLLVSYWANLFTPAGEVEQRKKPIHVEGAKNLQQLFIDTASSYDEKGLLLHYEF